MAEPAKKSPFAAALITLALPGVGHFYAGTWVRGAGVMIGLYFASMVCMVAGMFGFLGIAALYGLAAWDASRMARAFNDAPAIAAEAAPPPSMLLLLLWAAGRAVWILALFGYGALVSFAGILEALVRRHSVPLALLCALPAAVCLWIVWLAVRDTWRGLTRRGSRTAAGVRDEVSATVLLGAIGALCLAIVWPSFRQLIRYSGEGAMKGSLGGLRQAIDAYKKTHDGAVPASLEAVLDAKTLPQVPSLWASLNETGHKKTSETIVMSERTGTDSGKWAYVVSPSSPELSGVVFIDCTHTDAKSSVWTSY